MNKDWLRPVGLPSSGVVAVMTTRAGGASLRPYDTMNLGVRVGDDSFAVTANRQIFATAIGASPVFLHQVHGNVVLRLQAQQAQQARDELGVDTHEADAAFTTEPGIACTVQIADCMPVLLASKDGRVVGAAHAGWRGLAGGVLDNTVTAMCEAASLGAGDLCAWLGPCIGPAAFEVGADVVEAFAEDVSCMVPAPRPDGTMRWRADLPAIARRRLQRLGLHAVEGGTWCTVNDAARFFSFRRDKTTGRHAAAVWTCR